MSDQLQKLTQQTLASELAMLWTTHQFFITLHNVMLEQELKPDLSLDELHTKMESLTAEGHSAESSMLAEVQRVLQRARAGLAIIDGRIQVAVMRRFFERMGDSSPQQYKHIARYYLSKPAKDENDRDKVDLLVTRLCSFLTPGANSIKLRQPLGNLEEMLEELCKSKRSVEHESVQTALLTKLRQLSRPILEARSFNSLIEGKLLTNLREYKISLGETFYSPMVLAEIVKINIAVHNKFQELYYSEQARLRMETARMLRGLQDTGKHFTADVPSHPMVGQLNNLTIQMQQYIQELKRNLTDQILKDRVARASIEAEGSALTMLIGSLEESLKRSRELLKKVQDVYSRVGDKES